MQITGLHFLLTYQCTLECDHCFVWGSPWQNGTMTLADVRKILEQARDLGTVSSVYFEGGEPFLYYATLLHAVRMAAQMGFSVGIVTNSYWANTEEDSLASLRPFAGLVQDLTISSDRYHWGDLLSQKETFACAAADRLGIPVSVIRVAREVGAGAACPAGQLPEGESRVMYRGRAAAKLAAQAPKQPWESFDRCPHEDLREPGRVHVDSFGHVHICQGISLGNVFRKALREICADYDPERHPINGPLLAGGPAELLRRYGLAHAAEAADACQLCDAARTALRSRFPDILAPDAMYGVASG